MGDLSSSDIKDSGYPAKNEKRLKAPRLASRSFRVHNGKG